MLIILSITPAGVRYPSKVVHPASGYQQGRLHFLLTFFKMLLKKRIYSFAIQSRAIKPHIYSSSIINQFSSSFSSSSSSSSSCFRFSKSKFFGTPTNVLFTRNIEDLFVKNRHLFCSQPKSVENFKCWNCGVEADNATPFLFCQACRTVQPVNHSIDFFRIFGLERKYNIEGGELEGKYKDWQKKLHPDLVHSKSQREREYAAEQSARVIDAYRTLADPLSRAIYIVNLEGVVVDEEERITDPELLAEIMELREAVDEAEGAQSLNQIQAQLQEKLKYWSKSFEDAFLSKNYEDALASIRRMTYYRRANEEIVKKL